MASFLPSEDSKGNQHTQQSINQDNNEKKNLKNLAGSTQLERVLADAGRDLANADLGSPINELRDAGAGVLLPILGVLPNVIPHIAKSVPFADSISAFCLSVPFNMARASYGLLQHVNGSEDVETILDSRRRRSLITDTRLEAFLAEEVRRKCDQVSTADLDHQFLTEQDGSFTFKNITIHSSDGTFLSANVMEPTMKKGDELPAVIFVNSWTFTEHEYIIPASILARQGYVVLSYCTRGFGKSGGLVNVAGPLDQKDMGSVLDWLESNTQADMNNVGIAGISYGAGLSLIGAAMEDRIKTAVSMAGWADLGASLYGSSSPRIVWGAYLLMSGYLAGEMDPIINEQLSGIIAHENIEEILGWAAERSATTYAEKINAMNKPIYMSNSFGDDLFNANQAFRFFESLTVPKRMDCNQGIHGTPEFFGLTGEPNYVWDNVYNWFDFHLKGVNNVVMDSQLTMELKLQQSNREIFANWPSTRIAKRQFYLKPRGFFSFGSLSNTMNENEDRTAVHSLHIGSFATTGIPLISAFLEAHTNLPIPAPLGIHRFQSIVYYSEPLESTLQIRGKIKLNLSVASSIGKAQVVAYLYDNAGGMNNKLITHGVITEYELTPNMEKRITIDLQATAYDIPPDHKLAIAIDTHDPLYAPPTRELYTLTVFHHSTPDQTLQSSLELQCIA